jgi:ABC-type thiamine transport system ATPase subunit
VKEVTLLMVTHSLEDANQMKKAFRFNEGSLSQDR